MRHSIKKTTRWIALGLTLNLWACAVVQKQDETQSPPPKQVLTQEEKTEADVKVRHKVKAAPARSRDGAAALSLANRPVSGEFKDDLPGRYNPNFNTESYDSIQENPFLEVLKNPLSTFSIDVDTASYSNVRRFVRQGQMPPKGAVRLEEMINYFDYNYPTPSAKHPFSLVTEMADCPWNTQNKLLHVGLQGKTIDMKKAPANNLVFLLDVSGSMNAPNKLPLLKRSLKLLVDQMREEDKVSIVVYAGAAGVVLPATSGIKQETILSAMERLQAGGSTAGGAGIKLAYKIAQQNHIPGGNNRIILATDGDFNVGQSSDSDLVNMIEQKRQQGVYLTVLGFGMGNYKDSKMEKLADKGNGNYAYIDSLQEAKKVLVTEMGGTLVTIAKDVKLQLEFNPSKVASYRLIGYENRLLRAEDFDNDKKDAGEMGAGHTVTALYEIVPATGTHKGHDLKYQTSQVTGAAKYSDEWVNLKLRYKPPTSDTSTLITVPVKDQVKSLAASSDNFRFSAAVAGYGMILRQSKHKGDWQMNQVLKMAENAKGEDKEGYRKDFIQLVRETQGLMR